VATHVFQRLQHVEGDHSQQFTRRLSKELKSFNESKMEEGYTSVFASWNALHGKIDYRQMYEKALRNKSQSASSHETQVLDVLVGMVDEVCLSQARVEAVLAAD